MKYTAHVSTVTRPYIRLPVTRTPYTPTAVSYTHLTLPTNYSV